jgi:hypothetical protein
MLELVSSETGGLDLVKPPNPRMTAAWMRYEERYHISRHVPALVLLYEVPNKLCLSAAVYC